ncbi:hypothetical protein EXN66_Car009868 [Channa argus]|uniref:Uncharacterized protein n=1 Tax=Channa argus TaxID=215402 RepID=A0A6G1PV98_CHAAH|nr:hypothetical protein EXN66_Car009868 [Channa argus]
MVSDDGRAQDCPEKVTGTLWESPPAELTGSRLSFDLDTIIPPVKLHLKTAPLNYYRC